jgi:hypothetical protein
LRRRCLGVHIAIVPTGSVLTHADFHACSATHTTTG